MRENLTRSLQRHTFGLSLLLHMLLMGGFVIGWIHTPAPVHEKPPSMYIPSYTSPSYSQSSSQPQVQSRAQTKTSIAPAIAQSKSVSTLDQVRHASRAQTSTSTKVTEAINLVGDKKTTPKPLIILLGKALAAHLVYPKIAIDFRVRGTAYVGFVLHPDGTLSNVQLVQSSSAGVLDHEAVVAVSAMSPVKNVGLYLPEAKPLVVGIIFN